MKITDTYAQELTDHILSQFEFEEIRRSYLKCQDLSHYETGCKCKKVYMARMTQKAFEDELYRTIRDFIEN